MHKKIGKSIYCNSEADADTKVSQVRPSIRKNTATIIKKLMAFNFD
ncbi:hypothetical protein [Chryseobacterium sp. T1]